MKALLDTNIIIHREASKVINQDIGILYRWLERGKYTKCIHSLTIKEIENHKDKQIVESFHIKLDSYECIEIPSPLQEAVVQISNQFDINQNDRNDTQLLNEVFVGRADILITEDKKIRKKAIVLGIENKVFTIDSFLEKVFAEHPELVNYKVLNVLKTTFGLINLDDNFFTSLKEDYDGFQKWFIKKYDEEAYITINANKGLLLSFNKVEEIYVTIFNQREEQRRLIDLLEQWGFILWGKKNEEFVYVRDFSKRIDFNNLRHTYPYISKQKNCFIVPIYPEYHTELLPDSILNNESPEEFIEDFPHRNAISKVYISRALEPHPTEGDLLIFYRTGGYHKSVITTIGIVEEIRYDFVDEEDFVMYCRKSSIFPEDQLRKMWQHVTSKPFAVRFLYVYSFPHRINMSKLIELKILGGVNDPPRGFRKITKEQLDTILKETKSDESFIIN